MRNFLLLPSLMAIAIIAGGCVDSQSNIVAPPDDQESEPIPAVKVVFDYIEQNYPEMITYPNDMRVRRAEQDRYGWWHVRLDQYYKDLRVMYSETIAHLKPDLTMAWFDYDFISDLDLNTTPTLSQGEALALAMAHQGQIGGDANGLESAELLLYPENNNYCLCWFFLLTKTGSGGLWHYYIDADSGDVYYYWDGIIYGPQSGPSFGKSISRTAKAGCPTALLWGAWPGAPLRVPDKFIKYCGRSAVADLPQRSVICATA